MNGFGRGSLTITKGWALHKSRCPVSPDMRPPSSGGWKIVVNTVGIPSAPTAQTER
jgi:hypothetical protein